MSFKKFDVVWLRTASKQLEKLPSEIQLSLLEKLDDLLDDKENLDIRQLKNAKGFYRLKDGNYRIIYKLDKKNKIIYVTATAHRKEVYNYLESLKKIDF